MTNKTNSIEIGKPVLMIQANHLSISSTNLYVLQYLEARLNDSSVGITYKDFWEYHD